MILQSLAALAIAAVLAGVIGYSYLSIIKSNATSRKQTLAAQVLRQAADALAAEATDVDADGFPEASAGSGSTNVDGWYIPVSSGSPKFDVWATAFKYCTWHNGAATAGDGNTSSSSTSGRLKGKDPASPSSPVFAVISAGPDQVMQTSCAQAQTGSVAASSDDVMVTMTEGQILRGVVGTAYLSDPQPDKASLEALPTAAVKPGQVRVVGNSAYINVPGQGGTVASGTWAKMGSGSPGMVFPLIDTPTLILSQTTASLSPFSSLLKLSEGGVQFQVYSNAALTNLVKDSGVLAAGSSFNFQSWVGGSGPYFYRGRRKASLLDKNGVAVWSDWSSPVSGQNAYVARSMARPSILPDPACPVGWVRVPEMWIPIDSAKNVMDVPSFCVMPYPAVQSGGMVRTTASPADAWWGATPWVNVSWTNANTYCGSSNTQDAAGNAVSGAKLMRESQWLAIAHNMLSVAENWSDGKVGVADGGTSFLFQGLSSAAGLSSAQPAAYIPYLLPAQRRGKRLSTGAMVYDIGGNLMQFTYYDMPGGTNGKFTSGTVPLASRAVPFADGSRGVGVYSITVASGGIPARGGSYRDAAGAFNMAWGDPSYTWQWVGFRCTK